MGWLGSFDPEHRHPSGDRSRHGLAHPAARPHAVNSDATNDFTLEFVTTGTTMDWMVESGGATYNASTGVTATAFAIVGKERNGVFF
jgi:hypothetical protein